MGPSLGGPIQVLFLVEFSWIPGSKGFRSGHESQEHVIVVLDWADV